MIVNLDTLIADEGTIIVMGGIDTADGRRVIVAVDHRAARAIIEAMDEEGPVPAFVEPWAVLSREPEAVPS